jgi:hypothetical protein
LAAYTVYAVSTGLVWSSDVKRVAVAMLVFIGIGVGAAILVQIGFHVFAAIRAAVREGGGDGDQERIDRLIASEMVEDEMQKLVAWKASRAAAVGAGVGIIALLVTLACGGGTALGLHLMLWCCGAGSLAEGVMAIWFHQRGVRNG